MRISVFGMGYVGCVSMGCLARMGHSVTGMDVNPAKVDLVRAGLATIVEEGVDELIAEGRAAGRIEATSDPARAVAACDLSLLCLPTPSGRGGHPDLRAVEKVAGEIGQALAREGSSSPFHTVVLRSTVPPGTTDRVIRLVETASGRVHDRDFAVVHNPEFLREGSSIADFFAPPMIVVGTSSARGAAAVREMYAGLDAGVAEVPVRVAEMVKYASNSFHAVKVSFANEVGRICRALEIDGGEVMRVFRMDRALNLSGAYLRPGFAYGGSCLPKDLRGLCAMAAAGGVEAPLIEAVERSNASHIDSVLSRIVAAGSRRVALIGLSFKSGTDDLRESPAVTLAERLHGKGYEVRIFDDRVVYSNLTGRNRDYIDEHLPHIGRMLSGSLEEVVGSSDTVVVLQRTALPGTLLGGRTLIEVAD